MDKDNDYRYAAMQGAALAHVAAYYETKRLNYRAAQCRKAMGAR